MSVVRLTQGVLPLATHNGVFEEAFVFDPDPWNAVPRRDSTLGERVKTEPRCKICASAHRGEIEDLLALRSGYGSVLLPDGSEQRVTEDYIFSIAPERWGFKLNRNNLGTHFGKHFRRLGAPVSSSLGEPAPEVLPTGFVYCLIETGPGARAFKVGYAGTDVSARARDLQTGNPCPIRVLLSRPGSLSDERAFHELLSPWRAVGEWFTLASVDGRGFALPVLLSSWGDAA